MAFDNFGFDKRSAERIGRVVREVEAGGKDENSPVQSPRWPPGGKIFRMATFTGSWSVDTQKTVTFYNQTNTPNTAVVTNVFVDIASSTATGRVCAIARHGTAWFLIAAKC